MIRREVYQTMQELAERLEVTVSTVKNYRKRPAHKNPLRIGSAGKGGRFRVKEAAIAAWEAGEPGGAPVDGRSPERWQAHWHNFVAFYLPAAKVECEIRLKREPLGHEIVRSAWHIAEAHHPGIFERAKRPLTPDELARFRAALDDAEENG